MDHAAATPVSKRARRAMDKYLSKRFYNPSAIYKEGQDARRDLENFRTSAARMIEASAKEIIFTGSGTESDNLAILGMFERARQMENIKSPRIIISSIEHPGIREAAEEVRRRGGEVFLLPVDEYGRVDPNDAVRALTPNTVLVSVMLANNETGVIEPVSRIARLIREEKKRRGTLFPYVHTDASQAFNYLKVSVASLGVDLLTLDSSKVYGPKGAGLLYIRTGTKMHPIMFGGGQEKGLRPGTPSLSLIAGFIAALSDAKKGRESESSRLKRYKTDLMDGLVSLLPDSILNTPRFSAKDKEESLPNIVSISVPDMMAELAAIRLDKEGIMVSTGSSCGNLKDNSGTETVSALGRPEMKESTLRFSMGRLTRRGDVQKTLKAFKKVMQL
jgi:cysteine desulfurase